MRFGQKAPGLLSRKYIGSETKEIHLTYLSEVFQYRTKKPNNLGIYIYLIVNVTSAAFIAPIPKIFLNRDTIYWHT